MQIAEQQSKEIHIDCALGLFAGFRRNEICHSRWEWFDLENKTILIQPYGDLYSKESSYTSYPDESEIAKNTDKIPKGYRVST